MSDKKKTETLICPDCTTEFTISWRSKELFSYCSFCGYEFEEEELGEGNEEIEEEQDEHD